MSDRFHTPPARKPTDPRTRERLREAQAAESCALPAVCAAETKVTSAIGKRDKACATADKWVTAAADALDHARAELVSVSGPDRAALLLGISKPELRRSLSAANAQDGAE